MPRRSYTKRQALIRQAREGGPVELVEIPRVRCEACGDSTVYANADGSPRPHLRPARRGDPGWSEIVPVRVSCEGSAQVASEPRT
jgi:hypothetical protein